MRKSIVNINVIERTRALVAAAAWRVLLTCGRQGDGGRQGDSARKGRDALSASPRAGGACRGGERAGDEIVAARRY